MVPFAAMAYGYWQNEKKPFAVTFGALTLLFQPFAKIVLWREMWNVADVIVAIGLFVLAVADKEAHTKNSQYIKNAQTRNALFYKDILKYLKIAAKNKNDFRLYIERCYRNGWIGHDDYSFACFN